MSENTVNIEIDGKKILAEQGSMIIEAADDHEVYIPRFCYHKKLSIAANCRMCLVELEGGRKPMPACATPISEGMKIKTRSALARKTQKAVMEFLLINHPLDCPICDQGGQCELQDLAIGYGRDTSRYESTKTVVKDKDLGPLVSTDMTRCINCTRCVRFTQEIAGDQELGMMGRGEHAEVSTFVERAVTSEISGNIIDLCPVGALTSKPFRFSARAWELKQSPAIAAHDCLGSNINVHSLHNKVKRVVPKDNEAINEAWLSDRDRFSYEGINSEQRVTKPLLKKDGKWQEIDWTTAFEIVASSFENVKNAYGAERMGALVSPSATVEEQFLLHKIMRELGSNNIDHRLQLSDFRDQESLPVYPNLGVAINDLETLDVAFLIGSDIQREQPLAAARLLKANRADATIMTVNPYEFDTHFTSKHNIITSPATMVSALASIAKVLSKGKKLDAEITNLLKECKATAAAKAIAATLSDGEKKAVIIGAIARNAEEAADIRFFAKLIAELSDASFGELTQGANGAGAWLASAVPHRNLANGKVLASGKNAAQMLAEQLKAYLLFAVEPEFDCANPAIALNHLRDADFVVSCSAFVTDTMRTYADVILPIVPFTETGGSFVNCNGNWQSFSAVNSPLKQARPGWKVLRVLGNFLDLANFDYAKVEDISKEVKQAADVVKTEIDTTYMPTKIAVSEDLKRIAFWPIYRTDSIVRRSEPLQLAATEDLKALYVNAKMAADLKIKSDDIVEVQQGEFTVNVRVIIDNKLADNNVQIFAATDVSKQLGAAFGDVLIRRVS